MLNPLLYKALKEFYMAKNETNRGEPMERNIKDEKIRPSSS